LITLTDKKYSEFDNKSGYFILYSSSTSVSAEELAKFDAIVKSMRRL